MSCWSIGSKDDLTNQTFAYVQQYVSNIAHIVKGSLMTSFPMTNRKWVTLHICERHSHHILSYDQQQVSDIADFVKGSLITSVSITQFVSGIAHFLKGRLMASCPMANSLWVALQILWKAVLAWHLLIWPTGSEWHCTFCERQSHDICSYDKQQVSDIAD